MNEFFRNKFREMTGIQESTISTVDHVYASIPIRLVDSHHKLMQMDDVKILIWDSIYPKIKKGRTDLVLDCGIFNSTNPKYFLYPTNKIEGISSVLMPNFTEQFNELRKCLDLALNHPKRHQELVKKIYLDRFLSLCEVYSKIIKANPNIKSHEFYKKLVIEIYNFLGFDDVANFYNNKSQSFMHSGIIEKFLPWLIESSADIQFNLLDIINNSSLIDPPYFTYADNSKTINFVNSNNLKEIIELLRTGVLLPCKEIIYWTLALCGIKHFGRDFNFFTKIESFYKAKYDLETEFSKLQLTEGKNDGTFYIQFEKDTSYKLVKINDKIKGKKSPIPPKGIDVSTIPSIYMHIGNRFKEVYEDFVNSKNIHLIKMGEIIP